MTRDFLKEGEYELNMLEKIGKEERVVEEIEEESLDDQFKEEVHQNVLNMV